MYYRGVCQHGIFISLFSVYPSVLTSAQHELKIEKKKETFQSLLSSLVKNRENYLQYTRNLKSFLPSFFGEIPKEKHSELLPSFPLCSLCKPPFHITPVPPKAHQGDSLTQTTLTKTLLTLPS